MARRRRRSPLFMGALAALALLVLAPPALFGFAWWEAQQDPIVRRSSVAVADWPAGAKPVTVLLVSDSHVDKPDMPPARLARIVRTLNALHPDLVLLAGDYIGHKEDGVAAYTADEAIAPLALFKAPLGVIAVLGNHDTLDNREAYARAIRAHRITLLTDSVVRRGPLIIGGVDDGAMGHGKAWLTQAEMRAMGPGPRILLSHSPKVALYRKLPVSAVLAGHTHCGQINPPLERYYLRRPAAFRWLPCGRVEVNGAPLFVGAGLGTSLYPLRFRAPPDVWLITFGPTPEKALAGGGSAP